MPVYEFECRRGTVTERLVAMGTREIKCPCCSGKARKIISRCSFELKGGGWYADGYGTPKPAAPKSESPKESGKPAKSGDA